MGVKADGLVFVKGSLIQLSEVDRGWPCRFGAERQVHNELALISLNKCAGADPGIAARGFDLDSASDELGRCIGTMGSELPSRTN